MWVVPGARSPQTCFLSSKVDSDTKLASQGESVLMYLTMGISNHPLPFFPREIPESRLSTASVLVTWGAWGAATTWPRCTRAALERRKMRTRASTTWKWQRDWDKCKTQALPKKKFEGKLSYTIVFYCAGRKGLRIRTWYLFSDCCICLVNSKVVMLGDFIFTN